MTIERNFKNNSTCIKVDSGSSLKARIRIGGRFRTQQIVQKMRKIGAAAIFLYLFVFSLTRRYFRIQQILRKVRKIVAATICNILWFFVTSLFFSLTREGFRIQPLLRKVRKIVQLPLFFISSSSSLKRIADLNSFRLCRNDDAPSLALNFTIVLTFQRLISRTMQPWFNITLF